MSVLAALSFLFSIWGVVCLLVGVVLFLAMPMLSAISRFKGPSRFILRLAAFPIKRSAVIVSEHNDAIFRQISFDGLGVEEFVVDGEEKLSEDPDNALHYWLGMKFAIIDEEHGVIFDPRHAALGLRKRMKDKRDEAYYLATEEEWDRFDVKGWMPGVFAMPRDFELVNLSAVQELIDGGERSEFPKRVEELYINSRIPFQSRTSFMKFLYPTLAFAILFGGIWFMASQFGLPGGGDSPDRTIGYGFLSFLLLSRVRVRLRSAIDRIKAVDWPYVFAMCCFIFVPLGVVYGLYSVFGLWLTVAIVVATTVGFLLLPILTFLVQPSKPLSGALSNLFFKLGFKGYRQPVICWTSSKYEVRELDQLESTGDVVLYDLWGHTIGFTYLPEPGSWEAEPITHSKIAAQRPVPDGGRTMKSNLPEKFTYSETMKRDNYGAYLPKRLRDDHYYIRTGIALERFINSANGEKSLKKLLEAKEKHGGKTDGLDDSAVFKTTLVAGAFGGILGLALFVIPAFI